MARGDTVKAREWLEAMKQLGVDAGRLRQELAAIDLFDGKTGQAKQEFLSLVEEDDRNAGAWLALAQIARQTQDLELMQSALAALEQERTFAPGLLMLGDHALVENRAADARDYFKRALELEPQNQNTLLRLMLVANRLSDSGLLRHYSGKLLAMNPAHGVGNMMAGYVYMDEGQFDLAEASFRRSLAAGENTDVLHELSRVLFEQGKVADALPFARKSVALEPKHAHAWGTLARIEWHLGLRNDAMESLQRAMSLDPGRMPGVDLVAAELYIAQGDNTEAVAALTRAGALHHRLSGSQKARWSELMRKLGKSPEPRLNEAPGDSLSRSDGGATLAEAKDSYEKAVAAFSDGHLVEARMQLAHARALQPDHPMVLGLSGRVELQSGEYNQASIFWEELKELIPESAAIEAGLAALDMYRGDFNSASNRLEKARSMDRADSYAIFYNAVLAARDTGVTGLENVIGTPGTITLAFFSETLVSEKAHLLNVLNRSQYDSLCRVLFGISPEKNPDQVLADAGASFTRAALALQGENWAGVADALAIVRASGVDAIAVEYDLNLARHKMNPTPETIRRLSRVLQKPGGRAFTGVFVLLCLKERRAADAEQMASALIDELPAIDRIMIRAALRRDQDDEEGAWAILSEIPAPQRAALAPWFEQDLPAVKKLRADKIFDSWLPDAK